MNKQRHQIIPAVYLIFREGPRVCMLRRFKTGWRDGEYTLPSGHVEENESVTQAGIREAAEEVGVQIRAEDMKFVHVVNRRAEAGEQERVDFFFEINKYSGKLVNNEPSKCDDMTWFDEGKLPANITPPIKQALTEVNRGQFYSEYNW